MTEFYDFSEVKTRTEYCPDGSQIHHVVELFRRGKTAKEQMSVLHRDGEPAYLKYNVYETVDGEQKVVLSEERWYSGGKLNGTDAQAAWTKWSQNGEVESQQFYKDGVHHRGNNKPAVFKRTVEGDYYVEFWVDGVEVSEPE